MEFIWNAPVPRKFIPTENALGTPHKILHKCRKNSYVSFFFDNVSQLFVRNFGVFYPGYFKFSEFEAIKASKFFKAITFRFLLREAVRIPYHFFKGY